MFMAKDLHEINRIPKALISGEKKQYFGAVN